jgi:hypothetical protein
MADKTLNSTAKRTAKRFFTMNEVRSHCTEDDAWVSINGNVIDLTPLIKKYCRGPLAAPLIRVAGTDITRWFDTTTGDLRTCIDEATGLPTYVQSFGRFIHCPTLCIDSTIDTSYDIPWWQDPKYIVGELTKKSRKLRVVNTLNGHEATLEVCSEETLREVQERYKSINAHAGSYTWKRHDTGTKILDMNKTLEENGITDESDEFESLGLPADYYVPAVHLYFNDDLTVG